MRQVFIAVFLSGIVWPGAGQIYNRDFLKGLVLILLTLLFGVSLMLGAGVEILHRIPPATSLWDTGHMARIMEQIREKNAGLLSTFNLLMSATWLYSIVDAYLGAKERVRKLLGNEQAGPDEQKPPNP